MSHDWFLHCSRRELLRRAAAIGALPALAPLLDPLPEPPRSAPPARWDGYEAALVVDMLASPGPFNTTQPATPLTPEHVRNAKASGITAINLTTDSIDFAATLRRMATWEREINEAPEVFQRVRSVADLLEAKRTGRLGIIYGFQGINPFGGDLANVAPLAAFGVRIVQLTYNVRTLAGDGSLESGNAGISSWGRDLIRELEAQRVIVDFSHAGRMTTATGLAACTRPPAISHSGCAALADVPRNQDDAALRLMADKGGVIGIYLMPFLTPGRQPTLPDVIAHLEHAIQVCGEDHVGIGSDLSITPHTVDEAYIQDHQRFVRRRQQLGIAAPGEDPGVYFFVPDLNTPRRLERIADALLARRHSTARVEKIIGGNFVRLMREVWG
jgi:membrane dipeptidase